MKRFNTYINLYLLIIVLFISYGCTNNYYPKPYGYFRVDLPEHQYQKIDTTFPYSFEISSIAYTTTKSNSKEKYWIDINYPTLNATVHCSYKSVDNDIYILSEDAHRSVYKHLVKADDIIEKAFVNQQNNVYGIFYDLRGNVASVAQFVLTDSIEHFFRGAVYFNHVPNKDSIAPMAEYIKTDIVRLMETFSWK
jgi:gliding motility-associated lipoprotein GldD